jgi:hypothetical protein
MTIISDFACKCCHDQVPSIKMINKSGLCIECYGNCVLFDDQGKCSIKKGMINDQLRADYIKQKKHTEHEDRDFR